MTFKGFLGADSCNFSNIKICQAKGVMQLSCSLSCRAQCTERFDMTFEVP